MQLTNLMCFYLGRLSPLTESDGQCSVVELLIKSESH